MSAQELPGVNPLEVFRLGDVLTVFRVTKTNQPYDPQLLEAFKSNYELGRPPRRAEKDSTPVHMGISVYLVQRRAAETARAFPKIGEYVAEAVLTPDIGVAFALTAEPGHLTLWGRPLQLVASVVDIVHIDDVEQ